MPNDVGYPGLPVLSEDERARRNLGKEAWKRSNSWAALGEYESLPSEAPFDQAGYDQKLQRLKANLQQDVADTSPMDPREYQEEKAYRDRVLSAKEPTPVTPRSTFQQVGNVAGVAGMMPSPLSPALLGLQSVQQMYDPYEEEGESRTGGAIEGALTLAGTAAAKKGYNWLRRVQNAPKGGISTPTGAGAKGPFSAYPPNIVSKSGDIHPPSLQALYDDALEASGTGRADLRGALPEPGGPSLSPDDIGAPGAAERFNLGDAKGVPTDREGMQRLIQALFGENPSPSVSRMTAQEALMDEAAIGMSKMGKPISGGPLERNNVIFGGATGREFGSGGDEAGRFVRPADRFPIGKKPTPPWRTGREEPIQWNQP